MTTNSFPKSHEVPRPRITCLCKVSFPLCNVKLVREGIIRQSDSTTKSFGDDLKGRERSAKEDSERKTTATKIRWADEGMFEKEKFSIFSKFQVMELIKVFFLFGSLWCAQTFNPLKVYDDCLFLFAVIDVLNKPIGKQNFRFHLRLHLAAMCKLIGLKSGATFSLKVVHSIIVHQKQTQAKHLHKTFRWKSGNSLEIFF